SESAYRSSQRAHLGSTSGGRLLQIFGLGELSLLFRRLRCDALLCALCVRISTRAQFNPSFLSYPARILRTKRYINGPTRIATGPHRKAKRSLPSKATPLITKGAPTT